MTPVEIERIAAGGDGVGRLPDGMTVFVPRTAPGDVVELEVVERKRRYARGRVVRLVREGADRVAAECPHYERDRCGGCQLQHFDVGAQRRAKSAIVGEALRRIGRLRVDDPDVVPAESAWRYRTRLTLAARGRRIGFHRYDAPNEVFDLEDCRLAREGLMAAWRAVREDGTVLPGGLAGVVLRVDREGALHVVVEADRGASWDPAPLGAVTGGATVWWRPRRGGARVVHGRSEAFPATAFEQVHPELAAVVRRDAVEGLGALDKEVVWDLYGGIGETAQLLAARGAVVWSVDRDRAAVAWANSHAGRSDGRWSIHHLAEPVELALPRLPVPARVVVNPPRGGLNPEVSEALERWGGEGDGRTLAYVSCDPATLARDLARMPAFAVRDVRAYDLFPQTSHVETLAMLEAA
jgi:23S rRNA (uracil1939-C5)-methyltransferase